MRPGLLGLSARVHGDRGDVSVRPQARAMGGAAAIVGASRRTATDAARERRGTRGGSRTRHGSGSEDPALDSARERGQDPTEAQGARGRGGARRAWESPAVRSPPELEGPSARSHAHHGGRVPAALVSMPRVRRSHVARDDVPEVRRLRGPRDGDGERSAGGVLRYVLREGPRRGHDDVTGSVKTRSA